MIELGCFLAVIALLAINANIVTRKKKKAQQRANSGYLRDTIKYN